MALLALGFWFWQRNDYSKDVLKLEILAPSRTVMGEEISFVVKYKNNGEIRLEKPTLIFEYPAGSLVPEGKSERQTLSLEDIYPGQEQNIEFPARLFGKEGDIKEARVLLQYAPKNLNAQFESETTAAVVLSSVPLNFELDIPSKVEAGQQFDFALNYFSNSEFPLSDLRIQLEYPGGFSFAKAVPSPIGDKEWKIGVLNKAGGGRIVVTGSLDGQVEEAKIFKAVLGIWRDGKFTALKEVARGLEITQTRLIIAQTINGLPDYTASPGEILHYVVSFKNASDKNLENLFLIVSLEGRPLDMGSVRTTGGMFQKGDNSIIWESKDSSRLRFLGKGEEGQVEFWVAVKNSWEVFSPQDKEFIIQNRVLLSDARAEFTAKVNSQVAIEQAVYFQDEVFGNLGPLPPQAGFPTSFTVLWKAKNFSNDAENAKVRAVLPEGVSLTGRIFPEDSHLTYDEASREVLWNIGDISAGTGTFSDALEIAFQIQLAPSVSQRGAILPLMGTAVITGDDRFTDREISGSDGAVDTRLPDDSSIIQNGIVL